MWHRLYGVETVGLRYFNVFGPRQDPTSEYAAVIPRFILWALRGTPLEIHGDGHQSRDFTYIDNVVEANCLAAKAPEVGGQTFNVGCGDRVSLLQIVERLETMLGHAVQRRHSPSRVGDVPHTLADIDRAERLLGYTPARGVRRGSATDAGLLQEDRMIRHWLAALLGAVLIVPVASGVALAQAPQNLVVQAPVEPPGLDLTATPASATAGRAALQRAGVPGEGGSHRQDRAVAGRALAHLGQQELHVLPAQGRPLPQRPRAEGGRHQVRAPAGDEPRDQASLPRLLRGDQRHHREGRLHGHHRAEVAQRQLPPEPRARRAR